MPRQAAARQAFTDFAIVGKLAAEPFQTVRPLSTVDCRLSTSQGALMARDLDIGFGIVGCGMISEFQADALSRVPGARVVAFCDSIEAAARARVERFGGSVYTDVEAMVRDPRVGAVSICTPSGSHLDPALAA